MKTSLSTSILLSVVLALSPNSVLALSKDLIECGQAFDALKEMQRIIKISAESSLIKKLETQKIMSVFVKVPTPSDPDSFHIGEDWYQAKGNTYFQLPGHLTDLGFRVAGSRATAVVLVDKAERERIMQSLKPENRKPIGSKELESNVLAFIQNAQKSSFHKLYSNVIRGGDQAEVLAMDQFLSRCSNLAEDPAYAQIGRSFKNQRESLRSTYPLFFQANEGNQGKALK